MGTDPTAGGGGGGGAKRRPADRQGEQREAAEGEAPTDRISALSVELRELIVARLPFMDAVRSGALARGWRDLWKSCRPSVQIRLDDHGAPQRELDALKREPRRRLHRFSLAVKTHEFRSSHLQRFLDHAAESRVEDLHVERDLPVERRWTASKIKLHLRQLSPHLVRLSLHSFGISSIYKGAPTFHALEVIQLYCVSTTQSAFKKMMVLCPRLRILDLRWCNDFFSDSFMVWPASLRSVTVAGCKGVADLAGVPSLRSFSFSVGFHKASAFKSIIHDDASVAPFSLPCDATLANLYIYFGYSVSRSHNARHLNNTLPNDLSGLTVLTVCCRTLQVLSSLCDDGATCQMPKQRSLQSLRELQLLMFEMEPANLDDIYVFLKTFQCSNLERLFVKLPRYPKEGSHDEVREEPPEDGLHNLKIVKVNNFNWRRAEVLLVSFLLGKASSLHKMLLVSRKAAPVDMPGVIQEALTNGKLLLSESDDAATQPYHSSEADSDD